MSWTDKLAAKALCDIRDRFNIKTLLETGTFKGIGTRFFSNHFEFVFSCEINKEYLMSAFGRLKNCPNVAVYNKSSPNFLEWFRRMYHRDKREDLVMCYLDAHFYDPSRMDKWVVRDELKALENFKHCAIAIHDFDNGQFGHCVYDGEHLGMNVVGDLIKKVNPEFHLYTNSRCSVITEKDIESTKGLEPDEPTLDNIRYAWSKPDQGKRGILYALPEKVNIPGLRKWI